MKKYPALFLLVLLLALGGAAATAQEGVGGVGRIAITGSDGNILLYDLADQQLRPLTTNASLEEPRRRYHWPTWSSDGQLAFFGSSSDPANPYSLASFLLRPDGKIKGVQSSDSEIFTYAHWAYSDCGEGTYCRDLALLYTDPQRGLALRLIRASDEVSIREVGEGAPFYWDWSPDSSQMLWARFSRTLEYYDVAADEVSMPLSLLPGLQQSIDWSPVDDRILTTLFTSRESISLVVLDGDNSYELASDIQARLAFHWSPDASLVAYSDFQQGALHIVDGRSGALLAAPAEGVVAFFWSPDGTKLAYLVLADGPPRPSAAAPLPGLLGEADGLRQRLQQQPPGLRLDWQMYDLSQGKIYHLASFAPTEDMLYYLAFFDQFSHSHQFWSPDSRYLVYGEQNASTENVVSLLDVSRPGTAAQPIADGSIGFFSWR